MSNSTTKAVTQADDSGASHTDLPAQIVLDKWVDNGFSWSGPVAPADFERLTTILSDEHAQSPLVADVTLYQKSNVLHLAFTLKGEVWLTCQRCLQPVAIDLSDDYDIALLDNDSQISLVEEDQDYLLLEEVISNQSPERLLPLKKLIEDEILLKTPMAPKHDDCNMVTSQVGEIEEEESENPFAALAALKGKL